MDVILSVRTYTMSSYHSIGLGNLALHSSRQHCTNYCTILGYWQTHLRVGIYVELFCMHSSVVHPRPRHITAKHRHSTVTATQTKCNVVVSLHATSCSVTSLDHHLWSLTKTHPQSSITISSCSLSTTQLMVISLFSCLQLTSSVVSDETCIFVQNWSLLWD